VSRSPTANSTQEEKEAYSTAWAALQKLLRQGKSESGGERKCCFLNPGASGDASRSRFGTISAATGLDFPDDGRGLSLCDWDHDGREDLWITNRTGPRVRLMLNRYATGGSHWLSLRLTGDGTTVNRDAIGARIEIYPVASGTPLLRTVTAGNGFLSQSSVWQHTGLGTAERIEKVIVRWPGAAPETFTGVEVDGFYDLKQGTGAAVKWLPPDKPNPFPKAKPGAPPTEDPSEVARLVLLSPLPVPETFLPGPAGKSGLLLNLWSSTCLNCKAELKDWAPHLREWAAAGVPVASWCIDAEGPEAARVAKGSGFSGSILTTAKSGSKGPPSELPAMLDSLQKGCFGLQKDMPVPVSFLFDSRRRLVAIYKGPVSARQVKADFALLTADDSARRTAASPDKSGRWHDPLFAVGVKGPMGLLLSDGLKTAAEQLLLAAVSYYEAPLPEDAVPAQENWRRMELASSQHLLASWDLERKDYPSALRRYTASLAAVPALETRRDLARLCIGLKNPKFYPALLEQLEEIVKVDPNADDLGKLGVLKLELGRPAEAIAPLRESLASRPDATNYFQLGQALRATGDAAGAADAWSHSLQTKPDFMPVLNNLAWLRATHPDASLRDGAAAVKHATKAAELSGGKHPVVMATLAAAQAETGDFAAAEKTALRAKDLATAAGDTIWPPRLAAWIARFQQKQPVREN
jgi:tetratricopeptide (TPR) repeat protein